MPGPSVMVRVLGDLTGLGKSFDQSAGAGSTAASKIHGAFSGMLGTLNSTGVLGPFGAALATADGTLTQIQGHAKSIGPIMAGVGGAALGLGLALQAAGSKDAAAHQQLQAAIGATGKSYDEYAGKIEEAIKHQEHFGTTADQSQDALRILTQATGDPTKALGLLNTAADLAAAKHETLTGAAGQLGKAYNGNARLLKEFGVTTQTTTNKVADHQAAIDALSKKLSGQASAASQTFGGHMDAIKAKFEDQIAVIGQKYGPAITAAGAALTGIGAAIQISTALINLFRDSEILATTWTYAWAAALAVVDALEAASGITLIILAIAALIAIVILIVAHFESFGAVLSFFKAIALDVFNAVKGAAETAFNWIAANWPLILAILTGPFGLAVYFIVSNWNTIIGFLASIPGRISGALSGMWNFLSAEFKSVINAVLRAWNSLHFTTPSVDIFGLHTPSVTIGVPNVPLLAQGGLITQSGLVYAHAGEAISPIPNGIGGPAVVIHTANFATELDVDAFMRQAAWAARTRRL